MSDLESLKDVQIVELDCQNCPCEQDEGFHAKIFDLIPTLTSLNGKDKNGDDIDDGPSSFASDEDFGEDEEFDEEEEFSDEDEEDDEDDEEAETEVDEEEGEGEDEEDDGSGE